ncbi:Sugar transporter [Operophtera brumata]|nr:Sugar transporter [Operophtera brumata]
MVQGLSIGGIYINSIVISEYVHPSRRGYFITLKKVSIGIGSLCCHAMEPFWTWRQIAAFAAAPPVLAIVLTLFWPESPSFLALNGRFAECEKSFKWLNGNSEESQIHLKNLVEVCMEKCGRNKKRPGIHQILKKFLAKDFQKSIFIVSVLTLSLDLCGRYYFVAYVTEIMVKLLDNKTSAMFFTLGADLLTIVALSSSTIVIRYFNRRTLLFTFGSFTVILMLSISLLVYLNSIFKFPTAILWLTALIIIFLCFVVNIGVVPVSFALIGEIFPLEHKGLGSFISGIVFTSCFALSLKLTPVLILRTGLYGTYAIYAVCLALCLAMLYQILPETKDKPLQEIEDDLKGVHKIESSLMLEGKKLISNA